MKAFLISLPAVLLALNLISCANQAARTTTTSVTTTEHHNSHLDAAGLTEDRLNPDSAAAASQTNTR